MRLLNKLTLSSLRLNRKRTIVTVVGILLATALLTAVSTMVVTFQAGIVEREKYSTGDYHYAFYNRTKEQAEAIGDNRQVESVFQTAGIGYAYLPGCVNEDKPYLYLMAMDGEGFAHSSVHLIEGRFPAREGEIVVSDHIRTNGGVTYQVGDVLTLNVSRRVNAADGYALDQNNPYTGEEEELIPQYTKEYTVVGITERLHNRTEPRTAPGYTLLAYWDERENSVVDQGLETVYARYTAQGLKNRLQVTEDILGMDHGILEKYQNGTIGEEELSRWFGEGDVGGDFYENNYLIRYETLDFSGSFMQVLYVVGGIVLAVIVFTSVFCIHNSFAISITEKMRQYGMLASVGATPRQIRKNVYYEAFLLAAAGIPLGIVSGLAACGVVTGIVSGTLEELLGLPMKFAVSPPALLLAAALAVITIFFSARKPAKAASRVAPITAILGTTDNGETIRKEIRTPAYIRKLFGMGGVIAHKNMKRTRKKYRVVAASIAVSVMTFVAMFSFIDIAMRATDYYLADGYNLQWNMTDIENDLPVARAVAKEAGIKRFSLQRSCLLESFTEELVYTKKYEEFNGLQGENSPVETYITVYSLGEEEYQNYLKEAGISYEQAVKGAVLVNEYLEYDMEQSRYVKMKIYDYKAGDEISGVCEIISTGESGEESPSQETETQKEGTQKVPMTFSIAAVTDQVPIGFSSSSLRTGLLIVSDQWMDQHRELVRSEGTAFYDASAPDALQTLLAEEHQVSLAFIYNVAQQERENKSLYTIVAIFLYGFIAVISLIGVTNIFNTITTSMELRSKEFAMLRSVGMTEKEFRRMIRLESVFYGSRALVIGLAAGTFLSWLIYAGLSQGLDMGYQPPLPAMGISVAAVAALLLVIMHFSMKKICGQNVIETIRRDNI